MRCQIAASSDLLKRHTHTVTLYLFCHERISHIPVDLTRRYAAVCYTQNVDETATMKYMLSSLSCARTTDQPELPRCAYVTETFSTHQGRFTVFSVQQIPVFGHVSRGIHKTLKILENKRKNIMSLVEATTKNGVKG